MEIAINIKIDTYFVYLSMGPANFMSLSKLDYVQDFNIEVNVFPLANHKTSACKTVVRSYGYN